MSRYLAESQIAFLTGKVRHEKDPERAAEIRREIDVLRVDLAAEKALARLGDITPEQRVRIAEIFSAHLLDQIRAAVGGSDTTGTHAA